MNYWVNIVLFAAMALPFAALSYTPVDVAYGTLATGPNSIVFIDNESFYQLQVDTERNYIFSASELRAAGVIGFITGTKWLIGKTSDAGTGKGDVFVF